MAAKMPKTLLDVPESVLVEGVYGRLGVKDRKSLSLSCKRLRKVAIDGAVFSHTHTWVLQVDTVRNGDQVIIERINDESFHAAQLFRAKSLRFGNGAHAQLFLERYAQLSVEERWPIHYVSVEERWPIHYVSITSAASNNSTITLTPPLGTILPRLEYLYVHAPSGTQLDTQQVLTGLTNCTKLCLDATDNWEMPEHPMEVHACIFSHAPRLRTLTLGGVNITSIPSSPTAPALDNLQRLEVSHLGSAQELLEQLVPHMPHLRQLEVRNSPFSAIPDSVLGLLSLGSLKFANCSNLRAIPEAITQLTNLTNLCVELFRDLGPVTINPHIGLVTTLRALEIVGGVGSRALLPRALEQLSLLTRLRVSFCRAGSESLDLSRLRELRVLDAGCSALNINNNTFSGGNLPHLTEVRFEAQGAMPQAVFRPGLRKLTVQEASGPLPLTPAMASTLNLTDLEFWHYHNAELPEALGQLLTLTRLCIYSGNLERLPLSLPNLTNLKYLSVTFTRITSMPPLGALTNLKYVDISYNDLSALPEGVIAVRSLEAIRISDNNIRSLRWADLRVLPLCAHVYSFAKGTRYASYDPSNCELMSAIKMGDRYGRQTFHAAVEL